MPEGGYPELHWTTGMFRVPWAFTMWGPLMIGALKWNAQVHEGFGVVASEWQNFVSKRLRDDLVLMQRITHCRTPDQAWTVYAEFWQTAVDDYGREYMTIGRLVGGVTSKSLALAQSAAQEASADAFSASRIG
jgi:hypothetical protein